jgi:hypothetical protein
MAAKTAPAGLKTAGGNLWNDIASSYELRADEMRVLEDAAREADLIATLDEGMSGASLLVRGSQGQEVINPLISELRQHRSTLASLLRQLKLPEENGAAAGERSTSARAAANARWSRRGA